MIELEKKSSILVIGGGISGVAAARALLTFGYKNIWAYDDRVDVFTKSDFWLSHSNRISQTNQLQKLASTTISLAVISPGVAPNHPGYLWAKNRQIPIITEIDLAYCLYPSNSIGITGTNGKSTVTSLLETVLTDQNIPCIAGGNIGTAATTLASEGYLSKKKNLWILELSSYQLETSRHIELKGAVFTGFSSDHMERHKTLKNYFSAKWEIINRISTGGYIVIHISILELAIKWQQPIRTDIEYLVLFTDKNDILSEKINNQKLSIRLLYLNSKSFQIEDFSSQKKYSLNQNFCKYAHNLFNSALVLISALNEKSSLDFPTFVKSLNRYKSLPYRFEIVYQSRNLTIINDSKSTNLDSLTTALKSVSGPILLLVGGASKGESFSQLNQFKEKIVSAICFGKDGNRIYNEIISIQHKYFFPQLKNAIEEIPSLLNKNSHSTVLFSPGCASFDEFFNFEQRGAFFDQQLKLLEEFTPWKIE